VTGSCAGCVASAVTNKTGRIIVELSAAHGRSSRNNIRARDSLGNAPGGWHNRRRRCGSAKLNGAESPGVRCIAIFLDCPESLVVARINIGSGIIAPTLFRICTLKIIGGCTRLSLGRRLYRSQCVGA